LVNNELPHAGAADTSASHRPTDADISALQPLGE